MPTLVIGQGSRLRYADKQYDNLAYYYAAEGYEDVLERGVDSLTVASKIANSYEKLGNVEKASAWYLYLNRQHQLGKEEHLRLAMLLRSLGDYEGSLSLYEEYEQKYEPSAYTRQMIIESRELEKLKTPNESFYTTVQGVNTSASEMGVSYFTGNKVLVASSTRKQMSANRVYGWTGGNFYNLYTATLDDKGNIGKLSPLKGKGNTKFHDGPACYDAQNQLIYFTRDNYLKKKGYDENKVMRLKLYRGRLDGNKLKDIEELPFNSDHYSCGHPSISSDGKVLYFASDMPGGYGGTDIYRVSIGADGTLGVPENLGEKLNTSSNELFPYIHPVDDVLFFSSNGHFGLGGLDVFAAKINKDNKIRSVQNLGAPINSSRDDFSFVNNASQTLGYISSDRDGGVGSDDIYKFDQLRAIKNTVLLKGNAHDLLTSTKVDDVLIQILNHQGEIIDSVRSNGDGYFDVELRDIEGDITLIANKEDYKNATHTISFDPEKELYEEDVFLMRHMNYYVTGIILDKESGLPISGVQVTIKDQTKQDLLDPRMSNQSGYFESIKLDYGYQDAVRLEVTLEKEGYGKQVVMVSELLQIEPELFVKAELTKSAKTPNAVSTGIVEVGTDLTKALNLNVIYFDLNSSYIRTDAKVELDKIVKILNENPTMEIELNAHTDCRESYAYNMWLSDRRAKRSAAYIQSRITRPERVRSAKGYGETRLLNDCGCEPTNESSCSEEEHQLNRRTEFIVIKK